MNYTQNEKIEQVTDDTLVVGEVLKRFIPVLVEFKALECDNYSYCRIAMETIIRDLEPNYELISYRKKKDLIVFEMASKPKEAKCPYCGSTSKKVHSTYQREVQDLPIQNKKVILLVTTRKFFCDNKCYKKMFSERHILLIKSIKRD